MITSAVLFLLTAAVVFGTFVGLIAAAVLTAWMGAFDDDPYDATKRNEK